MADDQPPVSDSTPAPDASTPVAEPAVESAPLDAATIADVAAPTAVATAPEGGGADLSEQAAIDELLKQANFEDAAANSMPDMAAHQAAAAGPGAADLNASPFELPSFQQVMQDAQASSIDLLRDVELNVKIELGRSRMLVEDVLKLAEGSVVELDKLAGDPVDVFVNDRLVARGEVLVLNDNFCVRVNEIVAGLKEEGL
jgi:flagellar motor switch protein FliN